MENIRWDDVVFKLRKTRQKLALSLTPLGAVCAAAEGTGYKNRHLGKSRGERFDSGLVLSVQCDTPWAWNGRSVFLLALQSVSGNTHAVWSLFCKHRSGCSYWDPSGEFCLPSSRSPLLLRVSTKKKNKKKSVSPHDSPFIQARVRQPFQVPPDSAFDRSKMNSSRPSARYHTEPLKIMAQASRLAGPDDAVPSLPGSDSWLSERNIKKIRSLFLHVLVQSSYILLVDVVWMRRKGGIATWVLTCQNQNGVVVDGQPSQQLAAAKTAAGRRSPDEKAKILVDVPRRVSLFQTCCLSWLLAPWLYQVLGISWSVVFSSSELELPGSAFFARISELERRGSEDGERRDDSPWRERRRAVGKVLPAE